MYQTYSIEKDYPHIYKFLKDNHFSERYLTFLRKRMGYIKVNGVPVNIKAPLKSGDKLEVLSDTINNSAIMHCILPLDIVYEDEYYILINKPSGLSSIPTKSHYTHNLAGAVIHYLSQKQDNFTYRILTRLDKDTAGIVLIAKNLLAANSLQAIDKTYYALCHGEISNPTTIDRPILTLSTNGVNQRKRIISPDGKPATTFITPVKSYKGFTLVKITLTHGRTHQIRVHMSSIGHPLLGDELYGKKSNLITHTALLCKEFSFYHPFLKKILYFSIDFPDDFKNLLE